MPLANIYDPLLMHTVALQLRIAKCMTLEVEKASNDSGAQKLLHIDRMLQDSLQMYQKLAKEIPALETEILFIRGKDYFLRYTEGVFNWPRLGFLFL